MKCLQKYASVLKNLEQVESALEVKGTGVGLWGKRRREVEKEVRKRVPEFQVILGFCQQKVVSAPKTQASSPLRTALLQESAQRLLLLYHKYLPEVVAEARFDVGKVLASFDVSVVDDADEDSGIPEAAKKFHLIQRLHVFRTLKENDQFIWTGKTCTESLFFTFPYDELILSSASSRTYLYAILKSYVVTCIPALKDILLDLLSSLLSSCILFEENPTEPSLWFISLPCLLRALNATSPDNTNLTDEAESVVMFLDDCIQRCLKTPFRYIEEMRGSLASITSSSSNVDTCPSPLIMTVLEQLDAKTKADLLAPSDVLAISSFIRKLVFQLMGQAQSLIFLDFLVARVDRILSERRRWQSEHPAIAMAVKTEVKMIYAAIKPQQPVEVLAMSSSSLQGQLELIESSSSSEHLIIFVHCLCADQLFEANKRVTGDSLHIRSSIVFAFWISPFRLQTPNA